MPFGSKKGKTAASNNKQLCLGLPDILIAAVARHYGLQEREAAAGKPTCQSRAYARDQSTA